MNEPTTEAGKPTTIAGRLVLASGLTFHSGRRLADHPDLIADIEAEAVAVERARITAVVEGLPGYQFAMHHLREAVERAAVLAIVNPEAE
jgi:hypothetical protein